MHNDLSKFRTVKQKLVFVQHRFRQRRGEPVAAVPSYGAAQAACSWARLLEAPGVDLIEGHGTLTGPQEIVVGETLYRAEKILLATGTWPAMPEIPGIELALTSNDIFDVERFPERLLIVGGGYIATEFASIFSGLGANVVQSYRGELFLRGFDLDIRQFLGEEMRKAGVDLRFNHHVTALESQSSGPLPLNRHGDV